MKKKIKIHLPQKFAKNIQKNPSDFAMKRNSFIKANAHTVGTFHTKGWTKIFSV
jgi:hypothetical protein